MSRSASRRPSCPCCSIERQRCSSDAATARCDKCQSHLDDEPYHYHVSELNEAEVREEIYKNAPPNSLPSLENLPGHNAFNRLGLQMTLSSHEVSEAYTHDIYGPFTADDPGTADWLGNCAVANLALPVRARNDPSGLIKNVLLVGALLHFLCSVDVVVEQTITTINGWICDNIYEQQALGLHLLFCVYCLFKRTLDQTLNDVRISDLIKQSHSDAQIVFVAVAILHREVRHFRRVLEAAVLWRTGLLSQRFKQMLLHDLISLETELRYRLHIHCPHFPHWRNSIHGSTRNLRRSTTETIRLSLTLHQDLFTTSFHAPDPTGFQPPDETEQAATMHMGSSAQQHINIYTPQGDPSTWLMRIPSPPLPPPLKRFTTPLSVDESENLDIPDNDIDDTNNDEMGELDHVDETADPVVNSLFPGLRRRSPLRFSY